FRVQLAEDIQLRCGREVQQLLDLGHVMHLVSALEDVDAFLESDDWVAIKVSRALFELGEILNRLEGSLTAEQPLYVYAAQGGRIDPATELLRPDIAHQMEGRICVAVSVAIETRDAEAWLFAAAIVRGVKLLLRKRSHKEPQAVELLGVQDAIEESKEVLARDQLALRNVAEVGTRCQIHGRRKRRQEVFGNVEIHVESRQVARLLPLNFVNV